MNNKESIQELERMAVEANNKVIEVGEKTYVSKGLVEVNPFRGTDLITMSTLQGMSDFINNNIDNFPLNECYLQVQSHDKIRLLQKVNSSKNRDRLAVAGMPEDYEGFNFGYFMPVDEFLIGLTAHFKGDNNQENGDSYLRQFASKVVQNTQVETGDDGITQNLTIKKGISGGMKENAVAKPIVSLRPYRTFREVEQPASEFLFRVQTARTGEVECALFEADGGAWVLEAMANIKAYFAQHNPDIKIIC
jgi:hypothetical protein